MITNPKCISYQISSLYEMYVIQALAVIWAPEVFNEIFEAFIVLYRPDFGP